MDTENLPALVDQLIADNTALKVRVDELEKLSVRDPAVAPLFPDSFDGVHTGGQMYDWMSVVLHKYFGGDMPAPLTDVERAALAPNNPQKINPATGRAINAVTGREINPATGRDIDPATGLDV